MFGCPLFSGFNSHTPVRTHCCKQRWKRSAASKFFSILPLAITSLQRVQIEYVIPWYWIRLNAVASSSKCWLPAIIKPLFIRLYRCSGFVADEPGALPSLPDPRQICKDQGLHFSNCKAVPNRTLLRGYRSGNTHNSIRFFDKGRVQRRYGGSIALAEAFRCRSD
jgi:hypothetical protein